MIDKKNNGLTAGEKTFRKFEAWKNSMSDQDYVQIVRGDILNRTIIAKECDFSKSSLGSNPKIKPSLKELEDDLRERGILPPLTAKGKAEQTKPKSLDRESIKSAREQSRVPILEQEVVELKAENAALKGQLGRFSELSDVYQDMAEMK
jgi:hypothetical protein